MLNLDGKTFTTEVLNSKLPVLVDFWAPWCGPCRMLAPVVEELAADYEGKIKVAKINVDENPDLAGEYGVMSIPTLCFFVNGIVAFRTVGVKSKREIAAEIDANLGSNL
ncbi:MAG TPA: thioredoxin [Bacillota bacterium]